LALKNTFIKELQVKQDQQGNMHVIFLHIPKAAGSTLLRILDRYYNKDSIFEIVGSRLKATVAEFTSLPAARRAEIMLLRGHMPFGLHEYLPQPSTYITMFRDPTARVVSGYHFARTHSAHYLHEPINGGNLDIERFVSTGLTTETDNGQLRLLTGHIDDIEIGGCTSQLLDQAKSILSKHFAVVGLSERFDESLLLIKRKLGWNRLPLYLKRNVAKRRPPELPKHVLNTIRKHNELDYELYQWASERLQHELEQEGIQKELGKFRAANSIYQSYNELKRIPTRLLSRGRRVLARR
jgi:Galactose-3-O-sulfotransferase